MIAIVPAAGRGERMRSVTAGSKEALPLGGRTVLDFVLDEAFAAGAERAIVVSARDKGDVAAIAAARPECVDLRYQAAPAGLADAILSAGEASDALVLLGDTVFAGPGPSGLLAAARPAPDAALLLSEVPGAEARKYGVATLAGERVTRVVEKPSAPPPGPAAAIAARYFLSDRFLRLLAEVRAASSPGAEAQLSEALNRAVLAEMTILGVLTASKRFDCGSPEGYAEALAAFG